MLPKLAKHAAKALFIGQTQKRQKSLGLWGYGMLGSHAPNVPCTTAWVDRTIMRVCQPPRSNGACGLPQRKVLGLVRDACSQNLRLLTWSDHSNGLKSTSTVSKHGQLLCRIISLYSISRAVYTHQTIDCTGALKISAMDETFSVAIGDALLLEMHSAST